MKNIFKGLNEDGKYLLITKANTSNYEFIVTVCDDNNSESISIRLSSDSIIDLKNSIESEIPF